MNAKNVLDMLMGAAQQRQGGGGPDLGAILGQVLGQQGGGQAAQPQGSPGGPDLGGLLGQILGGQGGQAPAAQPQSGGLGGLGGMLGQVLGGGGQTRAAAPEAPQSGGLGGMLGQVLGGGQGGGGGLGGMLGQVLGGGRGAAPADQQAHPQGGLQDVLGQLLGGAQGLDRDALIARAKELIAQNPGLAAASAGGLGALILGTGTGRAVAKQAAVLGGLAVIGALAYRAYSNWQSGEGTGANQAALEPPPAGSGFEGGQDEAEQNNTAMIMIKAMIGAASADGRIDDAEKSRILGNIKKDQLTAEMKEFIEYEVANPADAATIAQYGTSAEMAAQIYTAARLVIEPDTRAEKTFLADLASGMQLEQELVAHIDAAAASLAA